MSSGLLDAGLSFGMGMEILVRFVHPPEAENCEMLEYWIIGFWDDAMLE